MSDVGPGLGWWKTLDGQWISPASNQPGDASVPNAIAPNAALATIGPYAEAFTTPPRVTLLDQPAPGKLASDFSVGTAVPRPPPSSRRPYLVVIAAVVLIVAAFGTTFALMGGSSNGVKALSANQVVGRARAASIREGSVHVVSTLQSAGLTVVYVNDTGTTSGEQQISVSNGARVTVLLVNGIAYIRGNVQGLETVFQATQAVAQRYTNTWLSFSSTDPAFKAITATLTLSSEGEEDFPASGATKLGTSDINAKSVIGIKGHLGGGIPGTVFVSTSGSPLPVEVKSSYQGATTSAIFSDWGEAIRLAVPHGAVSGTSFEAQLSPSPSQSDRAAQSNLTNALTEVMALYQDSQSFTPDGSPLTPTAVAMEAPEFSWTTGACGSASPSSCVSMQVADASTHGDGQAVVLAVYSPASGDCWYGLDLENPASSFADLGQNLALVTSGRTPTGVGTPGVFFAEKSPSTGSSPSAHCSANWAVTQPSFGWGTSYSNPGRAA